MWYYDETQKLFSGFVAEVSPGRDKNVFRGSTINTDYVYCSPSIICASYKSTMAFKASIIALVEQSHGFYKF